MINNYQRFREKNQKRMGVNMRDNVNFIFKGNSATHITNGKVTMPAAVVNKQEKDTGYIYTEFFNKLEMGSIWEVKTLHWLIAEEIINIKDVGYNKYLAYLCNIEVEDTWGYFKGPEKTYVNIKNEQDASLESLQKPVLVLPENILNFSDIIVIKQRPWLIQEYDAISSPGLIYYSLRATTISKEEIEKHQGEDVYIVRHENSYTPIVIDPVELLGVTIIGNNIPITLQTTDGYFKTNSKIQIKKRTADSVTFLLPFGVNEATVEIKVDGAIVQKKYKVED